MSGYRGKLLGVDLSAGRVAGEPIDLELAEEPVGWRGLRTYHLNKEVAPRGDAISPANTLILAAGGRIRNLERTFDLAAGIGPDQSQTRRAGAEVMNGEEG